MKKQKPESQHEKNARLALAIRDLRRASPDLQDWWRTHYRRIEGLLRASLGYRYVKATGYSNYPHENWERDKDRLQVEILKEELKEAGAVFSQEPDNFGNMGVAIRFQGVKVNDTPYEDWAIKQAYNAVFPGRIKIEDAPRGIGQYWILPEPPARFLPPEPPPDETVPKRKGRQR